MAPGSRPHIRLLLTALFAAALVSAAALAQHGQGAAIAPRAYLPLVARAQLPPTVTPLPAQPTPSPGGTAWLDYLNSLRALADLAPVAEDAQLSDGDRKHAIYMVKNDVLSHEEVKGAPFYTPEGAEAAGQSNVIVTSNVSTTDESVLDLWMVGPFHGIGMLDAQLQRVGFGSYREPGGSVAMGAALNVISGIDQLPSGVSFPIVWPADGKTSWLRSYSGGELPDPLAGCTGYSVPTGAPIYMQFGPANQTPVVTATTLRRGATVLEHCVYTGATYANPDGTQQNLGRLVLAGRGAVIILPRAPLSDGTYDVSATVDGQTYSWSFTVGARPAVAASAQ